MQSLLRSTCYKRLPEEYSKNKITVSVLHENANHTIVIDEVL